MTERDQDAKAESNGGGLLLSSISRRKMHLSCSLKIACFLWQCRYPIIRKFYKLLHEMVSICWCFELKSRQAVNPNLNCATKVKARHRAYRKLKQQLGMLRTKIVITEESQCYQATHANLGLCQCVELLHRKLKKSGIRRALRWCGGE